MNRMHKKMGIPLPYKIFFCCLLLTLYGIYKNGILPFIEGFSSIYFIGKLLCYPIIGWGIGFLFDIYWKHKYFYSYGLYGFLFSMILPISTPFFLYLFLLIFLFFLQSYMSKKDIPFHLLAFGKLLLVLLLLIFKTYNYANSLEHSSLYLYSYLDYLLGHHISGLFISNVFLLFFSFFLLSFDFYYKKEIPLYSYGVYFLMLLFYSFLKNDMLFFLSHIFSSTVLFVFLFLATISTFSPYTKKSIFIYSLFLGGFTLPCSLIFNFYEGAYVSLFFTNLCFIFYLFYRKISINRQKRKKEF